MQKWVCLVQITIDFDNWCTRGFPKIDHSGSAARIVLEQNKFSKNVISNRD